ncbi:MULTISPECIES: acyl-CoA synthetase [Streptomyces]|uniref:Long-chain fatty acid--CoA ligase n=1 Tax=Streptomyces morookaense TaxID=1970 RepID=A0A7Y7E804_STRMO|nr:MULTISPECIES: long-chain fatty acid--CoA ligase [Streptomyces]MCC2273961.1 long-chain fatty acid--CoA ligase [Streptomyces sp. ET3-23]NVK78812.1 long-chain fatty acid--CoA ligase [Streptomyces morookaense]GHF34962.1 fatty-acyl-CoA synthase [Streptomyces morookaense]
MQNHGIGSWPARRARRTPHRTALLHEEHATSYAELHDRSTRLAHLLRAHGIRQGDRVAFLGPNHPAFLEALFATGSLGAVFVPLNTRLAPPELRHQLQDSGSRLLLSLRHPAAPGLDDCTEVLEAEGGTYETLLAGSRDEPVDQPVGPDDLCMIMYTSGTGGRPKGAMLTHGNVLWNSLNVLVDTDLAGDEITLVSAPLFHTAALNMTCLPTLLKGGTAVLESAFDPGRTLELVQRHRITSLFGVPAMYDALAAAPGWDGADLGSLRTLICGGAPVPDRTIRRYLDRGLAFVQGYGMTETAPGVLLLDRNDAAEHAGSAGVPHFFTDVRLLGPAGEQVRPGEPGEVLVAGPNVGPGYWGRPAESAAAFRDGCWFRSGDLATVDAEGYAYLVDRLKDIFISGGENVCPAEVEAALLEHPAVAECAVFGVPDPTWGEAGRAVVVLRPGSTASAEELTAHLDGQLARYKIPKSVVFTDSLPRNGAGKLLKRLLRAAHGQY